MKHNFSIMNLNDAHIDEICADIKEQFDKEPVKVLEKVLGVDLPDNIVEPIIEGVKAKITVDAIGDVADALKGLFAKK